MRLIMLVMMLFSGAALAWEGFDYTSGSSIQIDAGNLVRNGETIEYFDYGTGNYHVAQVQSVSRTGVIVELQVYDETTEQYRSFQMHD